MARCVLYAGRRFRMQLGSAKSCVYVPMENSVVETLEFREDHEKCYDR
jgi:hypothetical protein